MTKRPDHLFVTASGDLYDTRRPEWHTLPPLREKFEYHFNDITTLARLKATLRAGEYTFPGAYRLAFVTQDGGILSFAAVRAEFRNVVWDFQNGASTGWRVVGLLNVDEAEEPIYCDHLGVQLNGDAEEVQHEAQATVSGDPEGHRQRDQAGAGLLHLSRDSG